MQMKCFPSEHTTKQQSRSDISHVKSDANGVSVSVEFKLEKVPLWTASPARGVRTHLSTCGKYFALRNAGIPFMQF
jgi:hypothetical protein